MTKSKSFRRHYLEQARKHQAAFRERMRQQGYREITIWVTNEAYTIIKARKGDISRFVSEAVKAQDGKTATDLTSEHPENIRSNSTSKQRQNITSNRTSNHSARYMSKEIEIKIIKLREQGLSLTEISKTLANEEIVSATGRPYSTGTISKVITRVRAR